MQCFLLSRVFLDHTGAQLFTKTKLTMAPCIKYDFTLFVKLARNMNRNKNFRFLHLCCTAPMYESPSVDIVFLLPASGQNTRTAAAPDCMHAFTVWLTIFHSASSIFQLWNVRGKDAGSATHWTHFCWFFRNWIKFPHVPAWRFIFSSKTGSFFFSWCWPLYYVFKRPVKVIF